ncbi:MAG: hypothetical protein ACRC46_04035 [Thermoguttaceae bacterium]
MRRFVLVCVVLCAASVGFCLAQDKPNPDRPNPERAARFENAMREMNQRANELRGAIREAKEKGRERAVEENTKALHELELRMANTRREFEGDRPQPPRDGQLGVGEEKLRELNARMERLKGELATARENKREVAVRELTQALENTEKERNAVRQRLENAQREGGDRPQPPRDGQREPQREGQRGDIGPDAIRELVTTVRQLRTEVENLRREVENLKRERR